MGHPDIGFETIGNATLIAFDKGPVLATDPWISGEAYFGSWVLSHQIPQEQMAAIEACPFIWISHGHPDHLDGPSLARFKGKQILLPDHFGRRVHDDLKREGLQVDVMPDRTWKRLSDNVRALCIADYLQDAILLIDVGGRLVVNLNDAKDRGWGRFVRDIIRTYKVSVLLSLFAVDADMCNFFDEAGQRIPLPASANSIPVGQLAAKTAANLGCTHYAPFSSMHRYQRTDSIWVDPYLTDLEEYPRTFSSKTTTLLPPFVRYDCGDDTHTAINPLPTPTVIYPPEKFGDSWSDPLDAREQELVRRYFQRIEHLRQVVDFVNIRVGGRDNVIKLAPKHLGRGVTFEVPRHSLVTAVECEIFDDLMIGNFMKTTLHGKWPGSRLYPEFNPYVSKFGDNGRARTKEDLARYFREYRARDPIGFMRHRLEQRSKDVIRGYLDPQSPAYRVAKKVYWQAKAGASGLFR